MPDRFRLVPLAWARRSLGRLALLATAVLVALWLLAASGHGLPLVVNRLAAAACFLLTGLHLGHWLLFEAIGPRDGNPDDDGDRWAQHALVGVVTLAAVTCFTGLAHEIGGLYFADEGIFLAQAQRINHGQLLKGWFVYPHLLFYLDAFALWLASLFRGPVDFLAQRLYGVVGELPTAALVSRAVTASLGAATVVPVFLLARRLAGNAAAAVAGVLLALSPLWVEVAQLNLADVPGGFFAALTMLLASRLLDRETRRDYLLAGVTAGLAAGAKYPAGVVAVALAGIWLLWRLRHRREPAPTPRQPLGLLWAALAAIAAFLVSTPSLLAFPAASVTGGADVLFGVRLYAQHGWPGVVRASNWGFYLGELRHAFGLVALPLGLLGCLLLRDPERRRVLWLIPFPVLDLLLLVSMKIALRRNLMPLLPVLAALLGVGLVTLVARLGELRWARTAPWRRRVALAAVALFAVLWPAAQTLGHLRQAGQVSTRELALRWIREHVPPGAFFVQEAYTPSLAAPPRYFSRQPRLAIRVPAAEMASPQYDYLLLASEAYDRFLRPDRVGDPALAEPAARYRALFDRFSLVQRWSSDEHAMGPTLRLYRLDPASPVYAEQATFAADEAWLADDAMRPAPGAVLFDEEGQWALFKQHLAAGRFRVSVEPPAAGTLTVRNRENEVVTTAILAADGTAEIELPRPDKDFLYVELPAGERLTGLALARAGDAGR